MLRRGNGAWKQMRVGCWRPGGLVLERAFPPFQFLVWKVVLLCGFLLDLFLRPWIFCLLFLFYWKRAGTGQYIRLIRWTHVTHLQITQLRTSVLLVNSKPDFAIPTSQRSPPHRTLASFVEAAVHVRGLHTLSSCSPFAPFLKIASRFFGSWLSSFSFLGRSLRSFKRKRKRKECWIWDLS